MPDPAPLMRPLGSDSLKPRTPAQAAAFAPAPPPKPAPAPMPEPTPIPAPPPAPVPQEPVPQPEEMPVYLFMPSQTQWTPEPPPQPEDDFDLDAVIASILGDDEEDEDDLPAAQDAVPTSAMPTPAYIPLCNDPPILPRRKRRAWLWILVFALVFGLAAWYFDLFDAAAPIPGKTASPKVTAPAIPTPTVTAPAIPTPTVTAPPIATPTVTPQETASPING